MKSWRPYAKLVVGDGRRYSQEPRIRFAEIVRGVDLRYPPGSGAGDAQPAKIESNCAIHETPKPKAYRSYSCKASYLDQPDSTLLSFRSSAPFVNVNKLVKASGNASVCSRSRNCCGGSFPLDRIRQRRQQTELGRALEVRSERSQRERLNFCTSKTPHVQLEAELGELVRRQGERTFLSRCRGKTARQAILSYTRALEEYTKRADQSERPA